MWKAQRWIDHLTPAKRLAAWAGLVAATYRVFLLPVSMEPSHHTASGWPSAGWSSERCLASRDRCSGTVSIRNEPLGPHLLREVAYVVAEM